VSPAASPIEKEAETMATQKVFKQRVRTRMTKTGESYTTARSQLLRKASPGTAEQVATTDGHKAQAAPSREPTRPTKSASKTPMPFSDDAVRGKTGRGYEEWFGILDAWGAAERNHTEIARWVATEHEVDGWWAQTITVGYERARGRRALGQMADGFTIGASRTINVDVDRLLAAFTSPSIRHRWLPDASMRQRPNKAAGTARFDWSDPPSRLVVWAVDKGGGKALATVSHEKLPDAETAERQKAAWRRRLTTLKSFLERD
jgi:uncharacterized protein YndB with AHSA1/START domain